MSGQFFTPMDEQAGEDNLLTALRSELARLLSLPDDRQAAFEKKVADVIDGVEDDRFVKDFSGSLHGLRRSGSGSCKRLNRLPMCKARTLTLRGLRTAN